MRRRSGPSWGVVGILLCMVAPHCGAAQSGPVAGVWRAHHATFNYYGITTLYTCDGLRTQVSNILEYLGARRDMKVTVSACVGFIRPVRSAFVTVDLHALAVATAAERGAVPGRWSAFIVKPDQPYFMGEGECELIRQMRQLITTDFSFQDLHYYTGCVPGEATLTDYRITGEVLKPLK